jgi:hypothetical protein
LVHLEDVLTRLADAGLSIYPDKLQLGQERIDILGHVFSNGVATTDPEKFMAVTEYIAPADPHEIQIFLGFVVFYHDNIRNFSLIARPVTRLLKKEADFQ